MIVKAASILVLARLLSACNTFEGIGKDIKKGGEAIEHATAK
ncbi:MAG: entericidin A/B family lipoprotein [Gammaproteobacteria bacterium]|nr:entericidin A/B family lipoprotein [Gammaproteobacteria bacterium]